MKDFRRHPPHVPTTSASPQTFSGLSLIPSCSTACSIANLRPAVFGAFSAAKLSPRLEPVFCSALFAPVSSFIQWSVSPTRRTVCVTQRSIGHCRFFCSCWKVRHCLRLCVLQKRHVLLIHQGEVFLELETELEPSLCVVVVLDKFRSKLQDFCDVRRRHITAPLPCASFASSVTRSTTNGVQQDHFMMWTPVQMI